MKTMKLLFILILIPFNLFAGNLPKEIDNCYHSSIENQGITPKVVKSNLNSECIDKLLERQQNNTQTLYWQLQRCTTQRSRSLCYSSILDSLSKPEKNWESTFSVDPMTDVSTAVIMNRAYRSFTGDNTLQHGGSLMIRCSNKTLEAFVSFSAVNDTIKDINRDVLVRVGKGEAVIDTWSSSVNGTSLFIPDPKPLISQMLEAGNENLIVRGSYPFLDDKEHAVTVMFSTYGLDKALDTITQQCPL